MPVERLNPGAGEPSAIRGMALLRTAKATELRDAYATVTGARSLVTASSWSGKAMASFMLALDQITPDLVLLAHGLDAQAAALTTYAGEVSRIQHEQCQLQARRVNAQESLVSATRSQASPLEQQMMRLGGSQGEAALARARRVDETIAAETGLLRQVEIEWAALVARRRRADDVCVAALSGTAALGKTAPFLTGGLGTVSSARLLRMLDGLSATDLAILLVTHPDLQERLSKAAPGDVAAWWSGMNGPASGTPSAAQAALIAALPAVIGNLGGVAYWARDAANRITLERRIAAAKKNVADSKAALPLGAFAHPGSIIRTNVNGEVQLRLQAELEALTAIKQALDAEINTVRLLVSLTDDEPPLAALSIGNLDVATNVTYAVPGMGTDASSMVGWADVAQRLSDEQGVVTEGTVTTAVVAWIGYATPKVPFSPDPNADVLGDDLARVGARNLASDLAGWNAVRMPGAALNVVAHSYGTTTSAYALVDSEVTVDSFVSLGSAGMPASIEGVHDLNVGHMYVGQAQDSIPVYEQGDGDQWAWVGRAGSGRHDPIAPEFGATAFGTNGNRNENLVAVTDHSVSMKLPGHGYLDRSTESLRNIAYATTDQPDKLSEHKDPGLSQKQKALFDSYGLWALYAR